MKKVSLLGAFLASALAMALTVPAMADTEAVVGPTPNSNEVNLTPGLTGGYVLTNDTTVGAGTAANPIIMNTGSNGFSIMQVLYGPSGNYNQLDASQTQTFLNANGISMMATVKYAGATDGLGYFANGATGAASAEYQSILTVSGISSAGFYSNGGLTVTPGSGANMVGPNSFLLTPSQSGSPFEFALQNSGTNYYSSNQNSVITGLTDGGGAYNHLAVFQITGGASAGSYVLAWEDAPLNYPTDSDYNDLVVQIQYVPEPSTLAIAGLGALGLIGYGLRRRKSQGA